MTRTTHLLNLEQQLLTPGTRTDPAALLALFAPDFREFGSSGRIFTREAILTLLKTETDFTPPEILHFEARELAPTLALATYRTERPATATQPVSSSLRSSLWTYQEERWQLLFHQGTRVQEAMAPTGA